MKKILITGAMGQIGTELTLFLRDKYGNSNVLASDIKNKNIEEITETGPFEIIDVLNGEKINEIVSKYNIDSIIHLAAILSAVGEEKPLLTWNININGLHNVLEVARHNNSQVFVPSSIAVFGPTTPKKNTPQDTIQRPTTIYGVTKVAGENLCDYYHVKYGLDTRGVRFPGLISNRTLPGGGTTDYAVHIYYEALKNKRYICPIKEGTYLDMMYMPDALRAIMMLMETESNKLKHRNAYNVTSMSFAPEEIASEIKKHIPDFRFEYDIDETFQKIADSWPDSIDDSCARKEWGWKPLYNLESMTEDMLAKLKTKLRKWGESYAAK
jgi:nucleoside-diphosphate-sugar epimerase